MKTANVRKYAAPTVALWITLLPGCSIQGIVADKVGDSIARGGDGYATDADLELVGAATPFGLKLMESLIVESPRHRGLLTAAARGFTQYAYAYVEVPADEMEERDVAAAYAARERARRLYLRARDYGLRALEVSHPGFTAEIARDPGSALAAMGRDDVPALHWTAIAWGAAISLGKDDAQMLSGLAPMRLMARRVLQLDEGYDAGSAHVFHINLAMSEPRPVRECEAAAQAHFERAVELSGGLSAAPFVAYAEAVSIPSGRREEFERLLALALRVDPAAAPTSRLANVLYQHRARWLGANADRLFSNQEELP
jgi:predicted anti-sigma-YlaC factor YlaD